MWFKIKYTHHSFALVAQSNWGLRVTQNAYFSLITHTKQLLSVIFCDTTAGIGATFRTHGRKRAVGQRDVEVELVIQIDVW